MQLDENTPNSVVSRPTAGAAGSEERWFREKAVGVTGTTFPADYCNDMLGNIRALLTRAGITRTKGSAGDSDLADAIEKLVSFAVFDLRRGSLEYVNASSVQIRPVVGGDVRFMIDGLLLSHTGNLVFDMTADLIPTEAASTVYYLYAYDDAGVLKPAIDSVPPFLPGGTKPGYHSSGGAYAGYLCVGFLCNDSASDVIPFECKNGEVSFKGYRNGDLYWSLSGTVPRAWATLSLSMVPVGARSVRFCHLLDADDMGVAFGASDASVNLPSGAGPHSFNSGGFKDVLAFTRNNSPTGTYAGSWGNGMFEMPIADPSSPAFRYGNTDEGPTLVFNSSDLILAAINFPYLPRI